MPEVSLVAILDADKEGFLRSETSLIQTIGRAARNAEGRDRPDLHLRIQQSRWPDHLLHDLIRLAPFIVRRGGGDEHSAGSWRTASWWRPSVSASGPPTIWR